MRGKRNMKKKWILGHKLQEMKIYEGKKEHEKKVF